MCPPSPAPTHAPRRAPARPDPAPALAWTEHEDGGQASPGESRRLLGPPTHSLAKPKCRLQAGLTLGVWGAPRKHAKCPQNTKFVKAKAKTKYEKRKEKLFAILKPPYFILSMIVIMVSLGVSITINLDVI